jgi:hypothetical protein
MAWIDGTHLPWIEAVIVGNYAEGVDIDGKPVFRLTLRNEHGTQFYCPIELVEPDIHAADRNWS